MIYDPLAPRAATRFGTPSPRPRACPTARAPAAESPPTHTPTYPHRRYSVRSVPSVPVGAPARGRVNRFAARSSRPLNCCEISAPPDGLHPRISPRAADGPRSSSYLAPGDTWGSESFNLPHVAYLPDSLPPKKSHGRHEGSVGATSVVRETKHLFYGVGV